MNIIFEIRGVAPVIGKCSARGVRVCESVSASVVAVCFTLRRVRFRIVFCVSVAGVSLRLIVRKLTFNRKGAYV